MFFVDNGYRVESGCVSILRTFYIQNIAIVADFSRSITFNIKKVHTILNIHILRVFDETFCMLNFLLY